MANNIPYNGNPTTAVNQYSANQRFSDNVDKLNAQLEFAGKLAPDLSKQLTFMRDVLTCMKSDTQAAILISKYLIKLASENPIGKAVFSIYDVGFETVFKMLIMNERVDNIRLVLDVFTDFIDSNLKAKNKLLKFNANTFLQGPVTFLLKQCYSANSIKLDPQQTNSLLAQLGNEGRQIVAAHDALLSQLVPGTKSIFDFVDGYKNPQAKDIIEFIGNGIIDRDMESFQFTLSDTNFKGTDNWVLSNRNNWANWCDMATKKTEDFL